jgi:tryptophan-rich sensory protein
MSLTTSTASGLDWSNCSTCSNRQSFGLPKFLLTVILLSLIHIHLLLNQLISMRLSLETAIVILMTTFIICLHMAIILAFLIVSHIDQTACIILIVIVLWCANGCTLTIVIHLNSSVRLTNFFHFKWV